MSTPSSKTRLTVREFERLDWPETEKWELLEGEILVSSQPLIRHQLLQSRLVRRMFSRMDEHPGGTLLFSDAGVRFADDSLVSPDIVYVGPERSGRIAQKWIDGAPDVIVEILSPSNRKTDLGRKRVAYERHGVPEYWIVDPENRTIDVLSLGNTGYVSRPYGIPDTMRSAGALPGFFYDVGEFFAP